MRKIIKSVLEEVNAKVLECQKQQGLSDKELTLDGKQVLESVEKVIKEDLDIGFITDVVNAECVLDCLITFENLSKFWARIPNEYLNFLANWLYFRFARVKEMIADFVTYLKEEKPYKKDVEENKIWLIRRIGYYFDLGPFNAFNTNDIVHDFYAMFMGSLIDYAFEFSKEGYTPEDEVLWNCFVECGGVLDFCRTTENIVSLDFIFKDFLNECCKKNKKKSNKKRSNYNG